MRMLVGVVLSFMVAGARARAQQPPPADVGAELRAAIRAKDARRVAALLAPGVEVHGAWSTDPVCYERYQRSRIEDEPATLAQCLAKVALQAVQRPPRAGSVAMLSVEPGLELQLGFDQGKVRSIMPLGGSRYTGPTLTRAAFEALRKTGSRDADATVRAALGARAKDQATPVVVWLRACIDERGAITDVDELTSSTPEPVLRGMRATIETTWSFAPFRIAGAARAACSLVQMTYPSASNPATETLPLLRPPVKLRPVKDVVQPVKIEKDHAPPDDVGGVENGEEGIPHGTADGPPPPPPPPPPQNVPPTLLEGYRIAGDKNITPDLDTRKEIQRAGRTKLIASVKMCLDKAGAVVLVQPLKSSGFQAYDLKIMREMRQWRYRPYEVNGKAVPVCTAVTYIYTQHDEPPAAPP